MYEKGPEIGTAYGMEMGPFWSLFWVPLLAWFVAYLGFWEAQLSKRYAKAASIVTWCWLCLGQVISATRGRMLCFSLAQHSSCCALPGPWLDTNVDVAAVQGEGVKVDRDALT